MSGSSMPGPADPDEIKAEIAGTREQLGKTLDELSNRLDVPARARERVDRVRESALDVYLENPPAVMAGVAATLVVAALLVWRSRKKKR